MRALVAYRSKIDEVRILRARGLGPREIAEHTGLSVRRVGQMLIDSLRYMPIETQRELSAQEILFLRVQREKAAAEGDHRAVMKYSELLQTWILGREPLLQQNIQYTWIPDNIAARADVQEHVRRIEQTIAGDGNGVDHGAAIAY